MFSQARELFMLKDLVSLRSEAESRVGSLGGSQIEVSEALKLAFESSFRIEASEDDVIRLDESLFVTTRKSGLSAYIPYQWLSRIQVCSEYISALLEYSEIVTLMKKTLGTELVKQLPCVDWRLKLNSDDVNKIDGFIGNQFNNQSDIDYFDSFIDGLTWQGIDLTSPRGIKGKTLDRGDYIGAAVKKSFKLISEMSSKLNRCIDAYMNSSEFRVLVNKATIRPASAVSTIMAELSTKAGENIVYYGAPGTGKSYAIDEIVKTSKHVSTVFHPDTQYSDFVGCLKPSMNGSDVEYKFREGPFSKILKVAHENPQAHCYLVIEEINRASAAAVFGEIFQLLDREPIGGSRYGVDINDPDMLSYLAINAPSVIIDGQLKLPSNLSIYATMNSSDQAVMPMDTAFKRRWRFKYKAINFSTCANGSFTILDSDKEPLTISWKDFAICTNECLADQGIPEDRHLGPWFLSSEELAEDSVNSVLTGKLFMYLWDDVLRHGLQGAVFDNSNIKNYGQLVQKFNTGELIFSEVLLDKFMKVSDVKELSLVAEPKPEYTFQNNREE
jgi:5-methylcytosine-specific restriction protein B